MCSTLFSASCFTLVLSPSPLYAMLISALVHERAEMKKWPRQSFSCGKLAGTGKTNSEGLMVEIIDLLSYCCCSVRSQCCSPAPPLEQASCSRRRRASKCAGHDEAQQSFSRPPGVQVPDSLGENNGRTSRPISSSHRVGSRELARWKALPERGRPRASDIILCEWK